MITDQLRSVPLNCPALYKASKSTVNDVSWVGAAIPRALAGSSPAFHPTTSYAAPAGSGPAGCHRKVTTPPRDSLARGSSRLGALGITSVGDGLGGCVPALVAVGLTGGRVDVGAGVSVAVGAGVGDGSGVCEGLLARRSASPWPLTSAPPRWLGQS
jgi:hypothetical protein